jgi:hypothetical protein
LRWDTFQDGHLLQEFVKVKNAFSGDKFKNYMFSPLKNLTYPEVEKNAPEMTSNTDLAIVWSHGLTSNKTASSYFFRFFASYGLPVYSFDHTDGTCTYTKLSDGNKVFYNYDKGGSTLHANFKMKQN